MRIRYLLSILAALFVISLPASLAAHDGHKQDLSDEELIMMEVGSAEREIPHGEGETHSVDAGQAATASMSAEQMMQHKIEENRLTSAGDLMSRLHPVAAHFPIALLIVAALAEFFVILRPTTGLETTVRFLVAGGAIGAVATTLFGWFAGGWRFADRSDTLAIHRWNGTTIAALSLLAWWLATRDKDRLGLRIVLAIIVVALIVQGYYGGEMVHGPNHMGIM